jgi:hypothetical protein
MDFDKIAFSRAQAATELASFKIWMSTKEFFGKTEAVAEMACAAEPNRKAA